MTPTTRRWRLAAAGGEGERGATTATAEQPLIGLGGGRQRGDRCRGDDRCSDDYDDYANRRAGKDNAPLDDGWRKRIRWMGKITRLFAESFLIGTLRKIVVHTGVFFSIPAGFKNQTPNLPKLVR